MVDGLIGGGSTADQGTKMNLVQKLKYTAETRYRRYLDLCTPHKYERWLGLLVLFTLYLVRVYFLEGFYIITYALGIFWLNQLIGFLSPQIDPEKNQLFEAPPSDEAEANALPLSKNDEFKPFIRRLPEFKFWLSLTKAVVIATVCTFFPFLDIPVFWPILLLYFLSLFFFTMKARIVHMWKHKYLPFDFGKPKHKGKSAS
eukprot:TRINITY_DN1820_c0_g1_i1.p2 TRINITY_DN1820_c0_g1~~TRINITY_DN1820_c0_g1_i1.p2  ORF type:complete len:236 (-),score=70.88 TRINITY_DN1820_c0_g1_i1:67-669(-)